MRCVPLIALLSLAGCVTTSDEPPPIKLIVKEPPFVEGDETSILVRDTQRNVAQYEELRMQMQTQKMVSLHRVIARAVDDNFALFRERALEGKTTLERDPAVRCIGFSIDNRTEARETLIVLLEDRDVTIVRNAALSLGFLRDPETDIGPLVRLLGSGDIWIRTNAATALKELFLVKETPRKLTPQYYTAIDRLVNLMNDQTSTRARIAAAWALSNLRHPEVLDHLIAALEDDEISVQVAGLRGIKLLGDQRALEAVLSFLEGSPTDEPASWAKLALESIAIQSGLAKHASELQANGTSGRKWREWFRSSRNR